MKLRVELAPGRFVSPLQMSSISASIVPWRVVPRYAERPIAARKGAQECKFQDVADISGVLITHRPPPNSRLANPSFGTGFLSLEQRWDSMSFGSTAP